MSKTADEKSKQEVADQVTDQKREYFVPSHEGGSIVAASADEAVKKAQARTKKRAAELKAGKSLPDEADQAEEAGDV